MDGLRIRKFESKDADAVSALIRRNFMEVNIKDYPIDEMERLSGYYNPDKLIELSGYAHLYVACLEGSVVGCGAIAPYNGRTDESTLLTIFVLPDHQGKGIGRLIIKRLEEDGFFLRAGRIEIPASITACNFYRRLGYDYKGGIKELNYKGLYVLEKYRRCLMDTITLTKRQARQFILLKQGLLGDYRFTGKEGIMEFVRQAGCIQFDPIDVCGKNAELVLQSRIKGFTKKMLYELLYDDRRLVDYFDKNLAILPLEDWPYFERIRESNRHYGRGRDEIDKIAEEIKAVIAEKGPVCSKDIGFNEKVDWYWSSTKLARAALETLYFRGELIIHHKKGTIKYYALAKDYIPQEILETEDPLHEHTEHLKWRVLRRIGAVGLLWNKPSDAWLFIWDLKASQRSLVFEELLSENKITELEIEGCRDKFYCLTADLHLVYEVQTSPEFKSRTELIAALDNMLWDRKLIKELFDFDYKWEIYTPQEQRKYGYYVLPVLMGERFIGRCEAVADYKKKTLNIKHVWLEKGIKPTKKLQEELDRCFRRFAKFHGSREIVYEDEAVPIRS